MKDRTMGQTMITQYVPPSSDFPSYPLPSSNLHHPIFHSRALNKSQGGHECHEETRIRTLKFVSIRDIRGSLLIVQRSPFLSLIFPFFPFARLTVFLVVGGRGETDQLVVVMLLKLTHGLGHLLVLGDDVTHLQFPRVARVAQL